MLTQGRATHYGFASSDLDSERGKKLDPVIHS